MSTPLEFVVLPRDKIIHHEDVDCDYEIQDQSVEEVCDGDVEIAH